jgi:quercetin dioxygenase-like cupin family protein
MKYPATLATVVVASIVVSAQQAPRIDPSAVPIDQEPNHQIVFANPHVRVIDARFPPGHVTLEHTHLADNSAITISTGRDDAEAAARVGRVGFTRGGYSHRVTNNGTIEMRFVAVEYIKGDRPGALAAADGPNHKLETENDRVRIYRVRLAPGESIASHSHQAGWLAVTVKGGDGPGRHQWHPGGSDIPLRVASGQQAVEIVELEPK